MKLDELTSFAHNVAHSLGSGVCFMVGWVFVEIHREAAASPEGHITVDFLSGAITGSPASPALRHAVGLYVQQLPALALRHGLDPGSIAVMTARFGTDRILGPHCLVTVETTDGRGSVDRYVGLDAKRFGKPIRRRRTA